MRPMIRSKELGLLDYSAALQERHEAATSAEARKEKGQVFTPAGVCRFMASRFTRIPERFRVLDPGAGIGSLSAAICERVMTLTECRRSTFDNVLQESVITHTQRSGVATPSTTITTSLGRDIPLKPDELTLPSAAILDDTSGDMVLRIPATAEDAAIMEAVESWPDRFAELGLQVSTGPVVLFRAEEFLLAKPGVKDTAPLIGPHNVRPFETVWPLEKRGKPTAFRVCAASVKHLVPTRNYVLLRRFSAKEERRRLTASWFLHSPEAGSYLALENYINYVYHADRELTVDEVFGLTALFNSALLDRYFRIISGNTQVNATEIRSIRYPAMKQVAMIGRRLKTVGDRQPAKVEAVVLGTLGINGRLGAYLMEEAAL